MLEARPAVLVVDMVGDFFGAGDLPAVPGREEIAAAVNRLTDAARAAAVPVVYTLDRFAPQEVAIDFECMRFGAHCVEGTPGAEVLEEIAPEPGDLVVAKKRFDSFFASPLDLLLRELGVDTVVLCGVHTDVCVQNTAAGAFFHGYSVIVPPECCASPDPADHEHGLRYMEQWYKAEVLALDAAIARIAATRPTAALAR